MLAGLDLRGLIGTTSSQYVPHNRAPARHPRVSKSEQNRCANFEMLQPISSGKVPSIHAF